MIIAIDGPGASGKSTTAKLLSRKIKFVHLNSGLLYRALTYIFIEYELLENDSLSIDDFFANNHITLEGKRLDKAIWNGSDITKYLSDEKINENINFISNNEIIRKYLVDKQRKLSINRNIVCEGRDIGTVVFPNADYKFFLIAELNSRINRRYNELKKNNSKITKEEIKINLINRDKNDIERNVSPLVKAEDAIEVDTTILSIEEQVKIIYNKIKQGV